MRIRTLGISFSLWLWAATSGHAISLEEVVRPQALFQIGEVQQSASLTYNYSGRHTSGGDTVHANRFQEKYSLSNETSILNPDLVLLTLAGGLVFDQFQSSTTHSNGIDYQYGVSGSAFSRKPYPMNFLSSHSTNQVTSAFTPTFSATTDSSQFGIRLLNRMLPLSLRYTRTSIEGQGTNQQTRSVNSNLMLQASNDFREVSTTEVALGFVSSESGTVGEPMLTARSYNFSLSNALSLDPERRYSLSSSLQTQQGIQNSLPQQSMDFTESVSARFGKALNGSASYQYSYNKTAVGSNQPDQELRYQNVTAGLSHTLYASLDTRIAGRYRTSEFLNGKEDTTGGTIGLGYRKRLPLESELTLGASYDHQLTDRTVSGTFTYPDQVFKGVKHRDKIQLAPAGGLVEVTRVWSNTPFTVYVEGRDYTVDLALGTLTVLDTAQMLDPLEELHISFTTIYVPAKYSSDTRSLNGNLSLFQSKYRLSGDYTVQNQHLIEGNPATVSLFDSTAVHLRLDANYEPHALSLEYGLFDSENNKYFYTEGAWRFVRSFSVSTLSLNMRDRYTWYEASSTSSSAFQENSFDAGTSLSRGLSSWGTALVSLNYINSNSNGVSRNYTFLRGELQGRLNLLQFVLSGQTMWRSARGQTSRDDTVHLEMSRPF